MGDIQPINMLIASLVLIGAGWIIGGGSLTCKSGDLPCLSTDAVRRKRLGEALSASDQLAVACENVVVAARAVERAIPGAAKKLGDELAAAEGEQNRAYTRFTTAMNRTAAATPTPTTRLTTTRGTTNTNTNYGADPSMPPRGADMPPVPTEF